MGTPITYLSGGTMGYQSGIFKNATTALGFTFPVTSGYRWWNGVDVTSSQYLLYSDLNSVGQATVSNSRPTAWSTPDLTDQSLLNLINTLPERVGLPGFTSISAALQWLQNTGTYFLIKTGYENIVTSNLQLNYDAGWYNSYNGSGTAVYDISGNNRTGTLYNGTGFNSSGVGAFVFDGTDDYMEAPSFNVDTQNEFTLEAWIKLNAVSGSYSIIKKNTSNDNWPIFSISVAGGDLEGYYSSAVYGQCLEGAYTTNDPIVPGVWYHVAFSKGTAGYTSMKLYINGISVPYSNYLYGSHINNLASSTKPIHIGRSLDGSTWTQPFNGTIAMTKIYNRQLSDTEVLQNYNAQKGRFGITSPVQNGMILQLDAANPASYPGTGTAWTDISSYGNNGTLVNGPTFNSANGGQIVFDGTDDWLNLPKAGFGLPSFTIDFWVKFTGPNGYLWVIADATGGNPELRMVYNGTKIELLWYDSGNYIFVTTTNATISTNTWYHISNTTTNNSYNFYINGVLDKALTGNGYDGGTLACHSMATYDLYGTSPGYGGFASMNLATYKFYNRVLSAAEVQQNFYALANRYGIGIVRNGLVLNLDAGNYASYPTSGTTWYDLSGNVNDGVLINGPTYSTNNGGVLDFDGTDDYGYVVRNTSTSPTNGLTQEAWVNFDVNDATQVVIGLQYGTGSGNSYALWFQPNAFFGGVNVDGSFTYFNYGWVPTPGNWYHLVHTWNGTTQKLYINNTEVNSTSTSGTLTYDANNKNIAIGGDYNGPGYDGGMTATVNGKIGATRIYNRALSSTEITQNYNADKARYGL